MPLGGFLAIFFLLLAAASGGALWYYSTHALAAVLSGAAYLFAVGKSLALAAFILAAVAIIFFIIARLLAAPLKRITRAMQAFADKGIRAPIRVPRLAPREVRELIGEFAKMSASVEAAQAHDKEVARVKSDFISTAAHQLRTPLTAVRWALEALSATPLSEDQRSLVENATAKSKDLVAIVGTLLDISLIESGKYKYQFAPLDLAALLENALADFIPLAGEHGVHLALAPGAAAPPVRADAERIKWVLNNLIENAIRYTPSGGSVTLSLAVAAGVAFLRVRDTGIGILPQDRGNIFERFFRGGNALSKESEGNGLGLYIARQIARDHGGDISFAANENGPGTTFTLALPVA
ncbi:MAG TPA: HAMP domain-containing sensor histidine kinase [Candidatus Paceibacterota bacterium]|nr:HAMP domain-containing sensor histidine kinase [Candidatus Paceibacterota bacterium]